MTISVSSFIRPEQLPHLTISHWEGSVVEDGAPPGKKVDELHQVSTRRGTLGDILHEA
jgi:hypothetical protein